MVEERVALVYAVGHALAPQRLLDALRLGVGAVQHGHVAPLVARRAYLVAYGRDDHFGLLAVGIGLYQADLLALVAGREAGLLHAARVVGYERVGGIDDSLRRAVVLFELVDVRAGIVVAEREYVLDLGTAERIDALRIVAHDAYIAVQLRQSAYDVVLRIVGVLILVHQDILEQLLVALRDFGEVSQQDARLQQQIVEVHGAVALGALAV